MKKLIIIKSCDACPYLGFFDIKAPWGSQSIFYCHKGKRISDRTEDIFRTCPLDDYAKILGRTEL